MILARLWWLSFLGIFCTYHSNMTIVKGVVERVLDGDTVVFRSSKGVKMRVRLLFIDAPELSQKSFGGVRVGIQSKNFLDQRVRGRNLKLRMSGKDRYERILGEIFYGQESLNLSMIEQGHAVPYKWAQHPSHQQKRLYLQTFWQAFEARLGIWSTQGMLLPYTYRKIF